MSVVCMRSPRCIFVNREPRWQPCNNAMAAWARQHTMTLRIERSLRQGMMGFTLSGRMKAEEVAELKALFATDYRSIVLDLRTEAANAAGELWGLERLERLLRSCSRMAPNEIVERILAEASEFANGEPQRDDVTLVVMKVQEGCEI